MRIKNIELHNFGSYAGHNSFNFESMAPEERVVVIGGKMVPAKQRFLQLCKYAFMEIMPSASKPLAKNT